MSKLKEFVSNILQKKIVIPTTIKGIKEVLGKEYKEYHEFLQVYEEKIKAIKNLHELWDKAKISLLDKEVREIENINKRLLEKLDVILTSEKKWLKKPTIKTQKEELDNYSIDYISKKITINEKIIPQLAVNLKKIIESLIFIKKLIKTQNEILKQSKVQGIVKDLDNKSSTLFHSMNSELVTDREVKHAFITLIRMLTLLDSTVKLNTIRFTRIVNPNSSDLESFYQMYEKMFPDENERESYAYYQSIINKGYRLDRERKNLSNIYAAKLGNQVIGASIFDFMGAENNVCFGVGWFIMVDYNFRERGIGSSLIYHRITTLQSQARLHKYNELNFFMAESNDPKKMTEEQIKTDTEESLDPKIRLQMWKKRGYKKLDFNYVQPPLIGQAGIGKPVTYLMLLLMPISEDWKQKEYVDAETMKNVLKHYILNGFDWNNPSVREEYEKMCEDIDRRGKIKLISDFI